MSKKDVEKAITTAKPSEIDNKQEEVKLDQHHHHYQNNDIHSIEL